MTQEIVRELVDGVWVTRPKDQGGSPGGGITEITSTDMSVTITDPTGPTVDLSVSGGSPPGAARWIGPWTVYEAAFQQLNIFAEGGTYTLTDDGDETAAIPFDATPAEVAAALNTATTAGRWVSEGAGAATALLSIGAGFIPVALTADGTNLTGDGASASFQATGEFEVPLFTPAVGDIIEDILWEVTAAFAGTANLAVRDDDNESLSGITAYPTLNDILDDRSNFSGNENNSDPTNAPTAYGIELAGGGPYPIIPAVCLTSVPISAYLAGGDVPPAGVVKVWVKTATPAAP